jgi:hypothetical protein
MVILNANLVVVVIKQFVSHNVPVDQAALVDVLVDIPQHSATFVKLMSVVSSKTQF